MLRQSLVDETIELLLDKLLDQQFDLNQPLPPEKELAAQLQVSRLTLREAITVLRSYGVVDVLRGRGTYIRNYDEWAATTPVISAIVKREPEEKSALNLMGCRRMIEMGAITDFIPLRSEDDVELMGELFELMEKSSRDGDVETFAARDIEFHNVFISGCSNTFVPMILRPISEQLIRRRMQTSSDPEIRERAQGHHKNILDAVERRDVDQARAAVSAHLDQTWDDLQRTLNVEVLRKDIFRRDRGQTGE